MELIDLWHVLINVFLPTALFVSVGFLMVYSGARFLGKIQIPGQGITIASFAALGGVIGVVTGASKSPTVGALLPALLTFITALLGVMFSQDKLSEYRPIIPYCIMVLILTSYFGLFAGSSIRGKDEDFQRNYNEWLLDFQNVKLEVEKAKRLQEIKANKETNTTK